MIPLLVILISWMAVSLYTDIYNTIQKGFDKKLLALGNSVSSFVRGEDIQELHKFEQFRGVTFDTKRQVLYASYFIPNKIFKINPSTGEQEDISLGEFSWLEDITYHSVEDAIYSINNIEFDDNDSPIQSALIRIDLKTNGVEEVMIMENGCFGIVYDPELDKLLCNNDKALFTIDLKEKSVSEPAFLNMGDVRGLAYNSKEKFIYGIRVDANEIIAIKSVKEKEDVLQNDKKLVKENYRYVISSYGFLLSKHAHENRYDFKLERNSFLFAAWGIAFNSKSNLLYASTLAPLLVVDLEKTISENKNDEAEKDSLTYLSTTRFAFQNVQQNAYRELNERYIVPMVHARNKSSVTFLFGLQLFDKGNQARYTFDAEQGTFNAFTNLELPAEDAELVNVWFTSKPFLKDIWDSPWGLLKSSYVAISDQYGNTTALAGADINVEVINSKTRKALYITLLIGVLMIVLAIVISIGTANKLTEPLKLLKHGAIQISSGNFGYQCAPSHFKELQGVVGALNETSISLKETIHHLQKSNISIKRNLHEHILYKFLEGSYMPNHHKSLNFASTSSMSLGSQSFLRSSELVSSKNFSVLWIGEKKSSKYLAIEEKFSVAFNVLKILKEFHDHQSIEEYLKIIFENTVDGFALLNHSTNKIYVYLYHTSVNFLYGNPSSIQINKPSTDAKSAIEVDFKGIFIFYESSIAMNKDLINNLNTSKDINTMKEIFKMTTEKKKEEFVVMRSA